MSKRPLVIQRERPDELSGLAWKWQTDKGPAGHNFTPAYDRIFGPVRMTIERVLEIGVFMGGSLKMWHDYFPRAHVVGVDKVDYAATCPKSKWPRIDIVTGDAALPATRDAVLKLEGAKFDIIIDDGSHDPVEVAEIHANLGPLLKNGGYYVIEDIEMREKGLATAKGHSLWVSWG